MSDTIDDQLKGTLAEYLPVHKKQKPFITVTYACSLDSRISSGPGIRTAISHEQTKAMTQYLRLHHEGILIGVNTANADNPGLNCKYPVENCREQSPIPLIIDPNCRWNVQEDSKLINLAQSGEGKPPWAITLQKNSYMKEQEDLLQKIGGKVIKIDSDTFPSWEEVFQIIQNQGINSIMVEGGAHVINSLLVKSQLVDSIVITIGTVFLGKDGVQVSPDGNIEMRNVKWWTGIRDAVMCGQN